MSFNHETQQKINQFAQEQAQHYLDTTEMTYMEKLRWKTEQTKRKTTRKLARFKARSDQGREAQNDMILYMSDYMNDLMSQGLSEQESFEKAKEELSASGDSEIYNDLQRRFQQYYETRDPADYETTGLIYGGFTIIGMVIGAFVSYTNVGGRSAFLDGGWIDTLIGIGAGMMVGVGFAMICNAIIIYIKKK